MVLLIQMPVTGNQCLNLSVAFISAMLKSFLGLLFTCGCLAHVAGCRRWVHNGCRCGIAGVCWKAVGECALFSLEKNLVHNQMLPQIKRVPATGFALRIRNIAASILCIIFWKVEPYFLELCFSHAYSVHCTIPSDVIILLRCNAVFMPGIENLAPSVSQWCI